MDQIEKLKRWVGDGTTWIGVFENHDLGHRLAGQRCAFPFDDRFWDSAVIGSTKAPDGVHIGLGWRWILIAKTRDPNEALRLVCGVAR